MVRNSAPDQWSLWITGFRCHLLLLVLAMEMALVSTFRTDASNCRTEASASWAVQDPERVRNCGLPPSIISGTFSTRRSGFTSVGWKVMSNLVSWWGARKPSVGKMLKFGASAVVSHMNFVPTSPVFSSWRRFTTFEPSTTEPNGRLSLPSLASVPRHAPDSEKMVWRTPLTSTTKSSWNCRVRPGGLKLKVMSPASRARRNRFALGIIVTPYRCRFSTLGATEMVTGIRLRFTIRWAFIEVCRIRMAPKFTMDSAGLASSTRIGQPSPVTEMFTAWRPLI